MLLKLFFHDIKSNYKPFLITIAVFNAAIYLSAWLMVLGIRSDYSIILVMYSFLLLWLAIFAGFFVVAILIYRSTVTSIFSSEGYFTLTIPVKTYILLLSKVLSGLFWSFMLLFSISLAIVIYASAFNLGFGSDAFLIDNSSSGDFLGSIFVLLDFFMLAALVITMILLSNAIIFCFKSRNYKTFKVIAIFFGLTWIIGLIRGLFPFNFPLFASLYFLPFIIIFFGTSIYLVDRKIDL